MIKQHTIRIHNQILKLRSIERFLKSNNFEAAFQDATEEQLKKLDWILKNLNFEQLKIWAFKINEGSLETMSGRKLKKLCKEHSVPYWSRLDRFEMIGELQCKELGITSTHF